MPQSGAEVPAWRRCLDGTLCHLAAILLVVVSVHLLFLVFFPARWQANTNPDYWNYYEPLARNMLTGKGYVIKDGSLSLLYPPGFPLCLAAVFGISSWLGISDQTGLKVFILLTALATTGLLYVITRTLFNTRTALIAALLWCTYPFFIWQTKQPAPESPFVALLLLAFWLLVRGTAGRPLWTMAVLVGAGLGLASLIRPISILLCLPLGAAVFLTVKHWNLPRRAMWAALMLAGNVIAILPWEVWVWNRTHQWIAISTNGGASIWDGVTFAARPRGSGKLLDVDPTVRTLMLDAEKCCLPNPTGAKIFRFLADRFREDPVPVLKLAALKLKRPWYATQAQWFERETSLIQLPYLTVILAGIFLGWRRFPGARTFITAAVLTTLYFWGMAFLALPLLRYMMPAMALLMVPGAVTVEWLLEKAFLKRGPRLSTQAIG